MNDKLTELVMILDRSGSMAGLESDTIGGYNSMLDKQRLEDGRVLVTTVLFDSRMETLHDRRELSGVQHITDREYYVRGSTALLDALGTTISRISALQRCAEPAERPGRTIFVITTDGLENASREYSYEQVKRLVELQKREFDWEFLFLGANIDAVKEAGRIGIGASKAVRYNSDSIGTAINYETLACAVSEFRKKGAVSGSWKRAIEDDAERRS